MRGCRGTGRSQANWLRRARVSIAFLSAPITDGEKTPADVLRFAVDTPLAAFLIRRLMRRHAIDIAYVNGPRLLLAAAAVTDRFVFHSHSLLPQGEALRLAGSALRYRNASVIASSRFVAQPLAPFVDPALLSIVYNGVRGHTPRAGNPPTGRASALSGECPRRRDMTIS